MKELYTLNLDENNYVLCIAHTANDNIELDLSQYELEYMNAYQYINGQMILDEVKKAQIIAEREEQARIPTWDEVIESQLYFTALQTDTLLESEV